MAPRKLKKETKYYQSFDSVELNSYIISRQKMVKLSLSRFATSKGPVKLLIKQVKKLIHFYSLCQISSTL